MNAHLTCEPILKRTVTVKKRVMAGSLAMVCDSYGRSFLPFCGGGAETMNLWQMSGKRRFQLCLKKCTTMANGERNY